MKNNEGGVFMEKHFCVSVYVFNPDNKKFLLVKHKKLGKWIQPGGHIEMNEDPEEAAIRETFEETGLNVKLIGERYPREQDYIKPFALQKNIVKPDHIHIDFVYVAIPTDNSALIVNEEETDGLKWFSVEEVLEEKFETFPDVRVWCKEIVEKF